MTAYMAKSGESGDSPAPKEALLPAGHPAGHHGLQAYTGNYVEVPAGTCVDFPYHYSKYPGLGPKIAAGVFLRTPPVPVNLDLLAISGRFSNLQSMALSGDTTLEAFRPLVTRSASVIVQSPRDHRRILALKNYIKRANLLRLVKRERLVEQREDRVERHDQRVEKREIRADEKELMNHTIANGLEQERKKLEKDKQEASVALQQDRMKFEEERKSALLALEEGRRKLDEYKLQVSQQAVAHVKGDASVDEKDKGQVSLVVSSVQTADTRLGLVEKLIDIPKRTQAMGKSICENSEIVKKFIRPNASKIKKVLSAATTTSIITALRVEIGQLIGLPSGGSNGDSKVPFVNGTGNGASSTVAGAEAASTVAAAEAPSTVAAAEAPSTVAAAEAPSTVAGAEAASTVAGAEAASTAAGGKAV